MKLTLSIRNELYILGVLKDNPEIWFNELKKKTGLGPKTLTAVLKRLQNKNYVQMQKQELKSLYTATDAGLLFLNKGTKRGNGRLTGKQLDDCAAILAQNFVWKDQIWGWQCPIHARKKLIYRWECYKGVTVCCDEPDCKQINFWRERPWPPFFKPVLKDRSIQQWMKG